MSSRVLDVGAGAGDSTVVAARRVGSTGRVLATDVSASMLEVAAELARQPGLNNVDTRVVDAQRLDLAPDSFDAAVSGGRVEEDPLHAPTPAKIASASNGDPRTATCRCMYGPSPWCRTDLRVRHRQDFPRWSARGATSKRATSTIVFDDLRRHHSVAATCARDHEVSPQANANANA